jgi:hypothetical protein
MKIKEVWRSIYSIVLPRMAIFLLLLILLIVAARQPDPTYQKIPASDRKLNLTGLERVTTQYLDEHPDDYQKLIRIVTAADDALQRNNTFTRGTVMRWIKRALHREQVNETMPVFLFLKNVYLHDWEGAYLSQVNEGDREYLFDLIGATIGGMYRCTCAPPDQKTG